MVKSNQKSLQRSPVSLEVNAVALFAPLAHLPWAMLLDSATTKQVDAHPDARFDVIVAEPVATIVTNGNVSEITANKLSSFSNEDPFDLLEQWQQQLLGDPIQCNDLPFTGGCLGYFSYDLGRRFERLPCDAIDDIGLPEMAVGIYDWALIIDNEQQAVELIVFGSNDDWHRRWQWLQNQHAAVFNPFLLHGEWQHQITRERYQQQFDQVQQYLLSGDCYQINLTQRFQAQYQGDEWQAYVKLRAGNQAPFSAFIRLPDCALLSVSPERFLQLDGDLIQTKPIKGTRPRDSNAEQDQLSAQALQSASKDRAENLMIVDLLRNDIGRVATPGSVRVPKLFQIESFPAVHHLVSTITASLDPQYRGTDLLRSAFPGGSITGAPKIRAMEIIEQLEPHRRSLYCGSIGYLSLNGKIDTSITIRSLVAKNNTIYCWAGGGIVADSDCDAEYQEVFDKLSKVLPLLK
ncbi:aminodeoxychorismate synthase component I [Ferrimonas lipolytica]|uniref:aminodeoxychorismate synthase n=1 Tax=Ferrimonas lipolytica TaxID=2724191 RepID=A0A6H1UCD3_9GAMM|nr:aminodeoxychorismate synthase component I [Ferrimonas lipolytica]QIZ76721.1 aminodeoxychorismate synthase component I [Ferrimonas lipolytica]